MQSPTPKKPLFTIPKEDEVKFKQAGLTTREAEMLMLLAEGLSNKEIAQRANISAGTVRIHLENMFKKLHVRNRTEAAVKFSRKN